MKQQVAEMIPETDDDPLQAVEESADEKSQVEDQQSPEYWAKTEAELIARVQIAEARLQVQRGARQQEELSLMKMGKTWQAENTPKQRYKAHRDAPEPPRYGGELGLGNMPRFKHRAFEKVRSPEHNGVLQHWKHVMEGATSGEVVAQPKGSFSAQLGTERSVILPCANALSPPHVVVERDEARQPENEKLDTMLSPRLDSYRDDDLHEIWSPLSMTEALGEMPGLWTTLMHDEDRTKNGVHLSSDGVWLLIDLIEPPQEPSQEPMATPPRGVMEILPPRSSLSKSPPPGNRLSSSKSPPTKSRPMLSPKDLIRKKEEQELAAEEEPPKKYHSSRWAALKVSGVRNPLGLASATPPWLEGPMQVLEWACEKGQHMVLVRPRAKDSASACVIASDGRMCPATDLGLVVGVDTFQFTEDGTPLWFNPADASAQVGRVRLTTACVMTLPALPKNFDYEKDMSPPQQPEPEPSFDENLSIQAVEGPTASMEPEHFPDVRPEDVPPVRQADAVTTDASSGMFWQDVFSNPSLITVDEDGNSTTQPGSTTASEHGDVALFDTGYVNPVFEKQLHASAHETFLTELSSLELQGGISREFYAMTHPSVRVPRHGMATIAKLVRLEQKSKQASKPANPHWVKVLQMYAPQLATHTTAEKVTSAESQQTMEGVGGMEAVEVTPENDGVPLVPVTPAEATDSMEILNDESGKSDGFVQGKGADWDPNAALVKDAGKQVDDVVEDSKNVQASACDNETDVPANVIEGVRDSTTEVQAGLLNLFEAPEEGKVRAGLSNLFEASEGAAPIPTAEPVVVVVELTEEERLAAEEKRIADEIAAEEQRKVDEARQEREEVHEAAKLEVATLSQRIDRMEDGPEKDELEEELEEAMCAVESDEADVFDA